MKPREIDAIIDEKLFNTKRFIGNNQIYLGVPGAPDECPYYTAKMGDTWKAVEKLYDIGYLVSIERILHEGMPGNTAYQCTLHAYTIGRIQEGMNKGLIVGIAPKSEEAVCSAIIKAIELNAKAIQQQEEMKLVQESAKKDQT